MLQLPIKQSPIQAPLILLRIEAITVGVMGITGRYWQEMQRARTPVERLQLAISQLVSIASS